MSRLFIDLYLDEDVDVLVAELIRAYGFDAITSRDAEQLEASDEEQLAHAVNQGRALLTTIGLTLNLAQNYFRAGREHYGIILAIRRSPYEIARRLLLLLNHVTADEMKNQVRYI